MPRSYWRSIIAIGGWLVFAGTVGLAKPPDDPREFIGQTSQQEQARPGSEQTPPPTPVKPSLKPEAEEPIDQPTASEREAKEDYYKTQDLEAQQAMATETAKLVFWTRVQIVLAVLGTGLLFWNLFLNRAATRGALQAVEATERANEISDRTARHQLRAYVGIEEAKIVQLNVGTEPEVRFVFKNYGQTPALHLNYGVSITRSKNRNFLDLEVPYELELATLDPGATYGIRTPARFKLSVKDREAIIDGTVPMYVWGTVYYEDIFGGRRWIDIRRWVVGPHLVKSMGLADFPAPESKNYRKPPKHRMSDE